MTRLDVPSEGIESAHANLTREEFETEFNRLLKLSHLSAKYLSKITFSFLFFGTVVKRDLGVLHYIQIVNKSIT